MRGTQPGTAGILNAAFLATNGLLLVAFSIGTLHLNRAFVIFFSLLVGLLGFAVCYAWHQSASPDLRPRGVLNLLPLAFEAVWSVIIIYAFVLLAFPAFL